MRNNHGDSVIYIKTLGEFSITLGDCCISDQGVQAKKSWFLLEYLITNRNREISITELTDLFWGNDNSQNPQGALKTLMCRVRKLLSSLGYPPQSLVIQRRGSYAWNTDIETIVDAERFEELACKSTSDRIDAEIKIASCLAAIHLYKGDYLPRSSSEEWVIPIRTYYHSLYMKVVHQLLDIYLEAGNHHKIIEICEKAAIIEPFDESLHYNLIRSFYASGSQNKALEHYNRTVTMFYNEFAITPSERLKELYKMVQDKEHGIVTDLTILQEKLQEETHLTGAYLCEYAVFKDIYQLKNRSVARTGDSVYLCLLTISDLNGNLFKSHVMIKAMNELNDAIRSSLRQGDVYTRYSISQYMILLPAANYENGGKIIKRIISNFKKGYNRKDLSIEYALQLIVPAKTPQQ